MNNFKMSYLEDVNNLDFMKSFRDYFDGLGITLKEDTKIFSFIQKDIDEKNMKVLLIVNETNEIAAFSMFQENIIKDDWFFTFKTGFIREVYVCEKYRKLGLARKMLNEIERYFGELKVDVLMLTADNAIDFWSHNGFSNTFIKVVNDLSILIKRI